MGWLARLLLGAPRRPGEVSLTLDLSRLELCGLGRGATLEQVELCLGPPTDWFARRKGRLVYPGLGVVVAGDRDGRVREVSVALEPAWAWPFHGRDDVRGFRGRWVPGASETAPGEKELVATLGAPTRRDVDEEEVVLEWERKDWFVSADFGLEGALRVVCFDFEE